MRGKAKNRIKKYCAGVLAFSVFTSNTQIVLAEEINKESKPGWNLAWSDEFNGNKLDLTKWSYEKGNWIVDDEGNKVDSGWGNNELEYYTEGDNLEVKDGNLVITAKKETVNDPVQGEFDYTSSRIVTKDNYSKKYGRFEARMKLPEGNGLWPAFWMMPQDNVYGAWAASGEIDIMEARGNEIDSVEGTIHYGGNWPSNKYTGKKYDIPNGGEITDFHEYAVEWEPGEIRWYVDGVLCNTQNNWYSTDENGEKYSFSAPFDQEFYLILNLALGGWFAGMNPDDDFTQAEMLVDYVRVYDKVGGYEEVTEEPTVDKEALPEGAKLPIDGNYVYDVNFETGFNDITSGDTAFTNEWNFLRLSDFGGSATVSTENIGDKNFAKINVTDGGSQAYSVQLIQYVTMTKGHSYKLSYDAKSNTNRDMSVKVSGGADRSYPVYSENYADTLTSDVKHFEHIFTMTADSDANARLEFNVGLNSNPVWIGNVVLEETEIVEDYDSSKEPLKNGNYIYNGSFDKGTVDRKTYWNLDINNGAEGQYSVAEDTRELFISIKNGGSDISDLSLNQKGIKLVKNGEYTLTFKAKASEGNLLSTLFNNSKNIKAIIKDSEGKIISSQDVEVEIGNEMKEYTVSFSVGENSDKNGVLEFLIGGDNVGLYLDDIFLKNESSQDLDDKVIFPLKNGDFSQNLVGWDSWSVVGANSNVEDGRAIIELPNKFWDAGDGAEKWAVQFKQTGLQLYNDIEYLVSFDASSTIEREIELVAQNSGYYRQFEKQVTIGPETKRYTYSFKPTGDDIVELNFLMGKYGDYAPHKITIDNIVFEIKNYSNNVFENYNFEEEKTPWYIWSDSGASDSVVDGTWNINVPSVGNEFWSVQAIQEGIGLEEGKSYRLTFDINSSIPRKIQAVLEGSSKYLWETIDINEELKTYTVEFTHTESTNTDTKFLFALGNLEGQDALEPHTVKIDNVYLYEIPDLSIDEPEDTSNTITSIEATEGPVINVNTDGGCGFTFPIFNGGDIKFDDVKDDLVVFVKENNEYIDIESSSIWKYDTNFGHFWDGPGGYWFNPVKETTYVKLASKSNPNVFIEYTLYVEQVNTQVITAIDVNTQGPNIIVGTEGNCGFDYPKFNDGNATFNDVKDDIELFVQQNSQWVTIDNNPESGWIYDTNFGMWSDGGVGGYWFNPIEETTYVKVASKTNPDIYVVYTLAVGEYVFVNEVQLDKTNIELDSLESTDTLIVTILPSDATNKEVIWKSSNTEVATVDINGIVTAVGTGTAKITARTFDGNKISECTVNVSLGSGDNDNEQSKYEVKRISDTEVEFLLYQEGVKEGDEVILLCSKNDGIEKGFPMTAEGNKFTFMLDGVQLDGLQDGDRINYRFNVIIDGIGNLIEDCPVYIHKIDTVPPTTEDEDVTVVEKMINALPENITLENKAEVEATRAAYNKLTEAQKALISKENLDKLLLAESKIVELEKEDNNSGITANPDNSNNNNKLPQTGGVNTLYVLLIGVTLTISGMVLRKKNKKLV